MPDTLPVTYKDVLDAAKVIDGVANETPVMRSRTIDARSKCQVFFKCENFQRTGAFKFRGAFNALSRLDQHQRKAGVLTYSSGNHAQAVALAGSLLGIDTTIIMPDDAPEIKRRATAGYGAEIITYSRDETTREDLAREIHEQTRKTLIPPYDHVDVVAGQGTAGRELFLQAGELDYLLVCCGGGGLLSGCAISARELAPDCTVIGVEPANADDATRSFYSGTLQRVHNPDTIADGARTPYLGKITFPLIQAHVDEMVTVSDSELINAMFYVWERMKIIIEPTGALGIAALLYGSCVPAGARVGVLISGGNVDLATASMLLERRNDPN